MSGPAPNDVAVALKRLGHYRVMRAQEVAMMGDPDGLSGALYLALGCRETWLQNVEGGAKRDSSGKWVPQTDPSRMDVGVFQISRIHHPKSLSWMRACKAGTFKPEVEAATPYDAGFVPLFEDQLRFVDLELRDTVAYAADLGVPPKDQARFAVAAHNAGVGGATAGFKVGDLDLHTAGGDYSAWVLRARTEITRWLNSHTPWRL